MRYVYKHIATLFCQHQYFDSGAFQSIRIAPADESTAKLLIDIDIIAKRTSAGVHLLTSNIEAFADSENHPPIRLRIDCEDPYYINYTKLPQYHPRTNVLYFNNVNKNPISVADHEIATYPLHTEKYVGEKETIDVSYGIVQVPEIPLESKEYLANPQGKELPEYGTLPEMKSHSSFSLTNLATGVYDIYHDTEHQYRFYYQEEKMQPPPLAFIEIYLKELQMHYEADGTLAYQINFEPKQTIWKYFIVNPIYQKFEKLSIIHKKNKEEVFTPPTKQKVNGNQEALVFESKAKLPLLETPQNNFQLVDNYDRANRSGKIVIKNLVEASAHQLFSDTTGSDSVYSHIYI